MTAHPAVRWVRTAAFAMAAVTAMVSGGHGTSTAQPGYTDFDFYVVNATTNSLLLARYKTGDPYPEYVKPDTAPFPPPDGPKYHKVGPGEKFTIGMRVQDGDHTIQIDFDMVDKAGKRFAGGMVELRQFWAGYKQAAQVQHSAACWPGPDRTCNPRGWRDNTDTVSFVG
jgi:hypothetical protein